MKVLHVGWGFQPFRVGGLIEYVEDLMNEQARNGYEVFYFCSGRHYPIYRKPFLKKWKRNKVTIFEIINSPIVHSGYLGTLYPLMDISEKITENFFRKVLVELKPLIVHFQEFLGLPTSLIEITKEFRIPSVFTLHDYFTLCPTLKLFDYDLNDCYTIESGEKCVRCCSKIPEENSLILATISYKLRAMLQNSPSFYRAAKTFKTILEKILKKTVEDKKERFRSFDVLLSMKPSDYLKRRETNLKRLQIIDLLIAQSKWVENVYRSFISDSINIITVHSTVKHIDYINPKSINNIKYPIKFCTLNGCVSIPKGAYIIKDAMKIISSKKLLDKFEFHIFGGLHEEVRDVLQYQNVYFHGPYNVNDLNKILEDMHIGVIPSVCQEAYGYVGIELLAKGIPIIGNAKGGILDYVIEGFTGWLNKSCSAKELANIMENIIRFPQQIRELNGMILEKRGKIIKTIKTHFIELDNIYKRLIKTSFPD